ncbi:MAG: D-alanyl-D-alanine carboxypeptidase family protein [Bacillota bacterium]
MIKKLVLTALACAAVLASLGAAKQEAKPHDWQSASLLLMECHTSQILFEQNPDERRAPASLTKIMTLALICEAVAEGRLSLDDRVTATENAARMGGSQVWLYPGEELSLHDMLRAIAAGSANDACVAVAEHMSGSVGKFVDLMNSKAQALGMTNTHYRNVHGMDEEGHYTSARDVGTLSRFAASLPRLLEYTSIWVEPFRGGKLELVNTNSLVRRYRGCDGLKTGWTIQSGFCVSATAKRNDLRLMAVVMGGPSSTVRFSEATRMLNMGFSSFSAVPVAPAREEAGVVAVKGGKDEAVKAVVKDEFVVVVRRGAEQNLEKEIYLPARVKAPVAAGQKLGAIVIRRDGELVAEMDLVAQHAVAKAPIWMLFVRNLGRVARY